MTGKDKPTAVISYDKRLTLAALASVIASLVLFVLFVVFRSPLISICALTLAVVAAVIMIQNKKVVVSSGKVTVKYFLGIIKEQSFCPIDCGFFISEKFPGGKTYIDKRMLSTSVPGGAKKYIYLSDVYITKEQQDGWSYIYGEPILILKYSDNVYLRLSEFFDFNTSPFSE